MLDDRPFAGSSLCVVGNINRDIKLASIASGAHLFRDGETSTASIIETIGGGGANSAFAAAALGAKASFLGKIGDDPLGERLSRTLCRHYIQAHLSRSRTYPTGTSIALSYDSGYRHFISCLPANESLCFCDLDLSTLAGHDHLLRADIWFSESMLYEGNKALFQRARQLSLTVSIDLNWDPQWGRVDGMTIKARKNAVRNALPWVDIAHGNVRELTEFADVTDIDTALKQLIDWGAKAVVVHLGSKGAGYYDGRSLIVEPPTMVAKAVNSTGTGDVLSVCMMLLHHRHVMPIPQRLRLANGIVAEFMEGKRQLIPALDA